MFMALNVVSGILVSQPTVPFVVRPAIYPGPVRSRAFAGAASSPVMWLGSVCRLLIQPRPPAPLASDPVVPDVSSEEEEDLSSVSSEVVKPRPPSPPDPVPPAPSSLPRRPRLSRLLLVLIKSPSSVSSASPSPCRLIVRLPGVLLRLIVSSMVSCPSRLSLSASVILLSPMFRVLFMTTRKKLLMPVKVNVRKFCICVEFTV